MWLDKACRDALKKSLDLMVFQSMKYHESRIRDQHCPPLMPNPEALEFGSRRPFLRPALEATRSEIGTMLAKPKDA